MQLIERLRTTGDALLDKTLVLNATQVGYRLREGGWAPNETWVCMRDKVCVVTGGNSGLGKAVATRLAALGSRVYLVCRNRVRGEQAQLEIIRKTQNPDVLLELADLSHQASIRDFAERFSSREERLDVLINNAGVFMPQRRLSLEGIELTFATNTLGPFLLTNLLMPVLGRSAPSRVINVSSAALYFAKLNAQDPQFERRPYLGALAYAESKRAEVVLTELWARQLSGSGIAVHAMHPGWADTPTAWASVPRLMAPVRAFLRTPQQGADTLLWLAVNPDITAREAGQFWFDRRPRVTHRFGLGWSSEEEKQAFWHLCCRLSGWSPGSVSVAPGKHC